MKKQTKLFAILLTLALVIGVFAMGASAYGYDYAADAAEPETGETFISYSNFDSVIPGAVAQNKTIALSGSTTSMKHANAYTGTVSVVASSEGGVENRYVQFKNVGNASGSAYMQIYTGTGNTSPVNDTSYASVKRLNTQTYHVLDFDVFFPEGTITGTPAFGYQFRAYNADGKRVDLRKTGTGVLGLYNGTGYNARFEMSGNDIVLKGSEGTGYGSAVAVIEKNQWSHISIIVEGIVDDNGTADTYDDTIDIACYLALNGEIVHTHTFAAPDYSAANAAKCFNDDMTAIFIQELRLNHGPLTKGTVNLDNFALRIYDNTYDDAELAAILEEGVGADLTGWDRDSYDAVQMPFGKLIATVGDAEYGHIATAIANAPAGSTIELKASATSKLVVDKALTINLNGNTLPNIATAPGFAMEKTDEQIVITKATSALTVQWYECECGEGCIEEIETEVYNGNNIYESYKAATGKDPICKGMLDGTTKSTHVGFEDLSGIIEEFDNTITVNEDLLGETIELAPVYEEDTVIAVRIDSNGNEKYIFESDGFNGTSLDLSKGVTIKLLANVSSAKTIYVSAADVTIDLNGYRLTTLTSGAANRVSTFTVQADGFTLTSSQVGGAIFNATLNDKGTGYQGNPVVMISKDDITVYFEGQNDKGDTTMSIYAAQVLQAYNYACSFEINGGQYIGNGAADSTGLFYLRRCTASYTIEDAYFDGGNAIFAFAGANQPESTTVNINNCVFGTKKPIATYTFEGLKITFDNCYIGGKLDPSQTLSGAIAPTNAASTYVVKNSFIAASAVVGASFAEGQTAHSVDMTKQFAITQNTYTVDNYGKEALYTVSDATVSFNIDRMVADKNLKPVDVIWYAADGETVLAQNTALPGSNASCPTTPVEGTNGYVVSTYVDWNEDTYIPLGTTGTVSFTLKEGAGSVLMAGKIGIMFNFDMINHFQYSHYIPEAPEGITYKKVVIGGAEKALGSKMAINPETEIQYYTVHTWPTVNFSDSDYGCQITFEYDGQEYTYVAPGISIPKYALYIIENDKYSAELKTAMADLLRFIKTSKETASQTPSTALKAACTTAASYMSDASKAVDTTKTNDLSAVNEYIDAIKVMYHTSFGGSTVQADLKDGYAAIITGVNNRIYGNNIIGDTRFNANKYQAHNVRSWGMCEELSITIYSIDDVVDPTAQVVKIKEGAVAVASATFTAEGLINADTAATATTTAYYQALCAYAKSAQAYMEWRHIWIGTPGK